MCGTNRNVRECVYAEWSIYHRVYHIAAHNRIKFIALECANVEMCHEICMVDAEINVPHILKRIWCTLHHFK